MDQDGANPQFLLTGPSTVITPRFSPNSQKITYMSYENIVPAIYLLEIETGRRELLGSFPGMTFAPRFSPDGNTMILTLANMRPMARILSLIVTAAGRLKFIL